VVVISRTDAVKKQTAKGKLRALGLCAFDEIEKRQIYPKTQDIERKAEDD